MIDLPALKTNLKTIIDAANTTTASADLSSGMTDRVQKILKLNPLKIPVQASWYPYVTVYTDSKSVEPATTARTQLNGKREAQIDIKVVGAVWNSTVADDGEDDADDECEKLMENLEEVIRRNHDLSGAVLWTFPTNVTYHSLPIEEETHLRVGIMNLRAKLLY